MGRRPSSGIFGTFVKSVFGTGTTIKRSRDWSGRKVTTVKHHDTGKTKKYVHGAGLLGNATRTETRNADGKITERGKLKTTLFGTTIENANKTQSKGKVQRKFGQGLVRNQMVTKVSSLAGAQVGAGTTKSTILGITHTEYNGTCFGCEGTGKRIISCHKCDGSGLFEGECRCCTATGIFQLATKLCWACDGDGKRNGCECSKCKGTGWWTPPPRACRKCNGTGRFKVTCRKCEGNASFSVQCKRCDGSGVFRKRN